MEELDLSQVKTGQGAGGKDAGGLLNLLSSPAGAVDIGAVLGALIGALSMIPRMIAEMQEERRREQRVKLLMELLDRMMALVKEV